MDVEGKKEATCEKNRTQGNFTAFEPEHPIRIAFGLQDTSVHKPVCTFRHRHHEPCAFARHTVFGYGNTGNRKDLA